METISFDEARQRLQAHGLAPSVDDANLELLRLSLESGRRVVSASLRLHADPGIGLPVLMVEMAGKHGREVLAVAPGRGSLELLAETLGSDGTLETDVLPSAQGNEAIALLPASMDASPAAPPTIDRGGDQRVDELFARVVCAANPSVATELLAATVDLLLEEVDAERGLVALVRDGSLEPVLARERGGRDMEAPRGEIPRRVFAKVVASRQPVFVEDVFDRTISLIPSMSVLEKGVKSFLAAPLLDEGEVAGILYLDRRDHAVQFDRHARVLFESLTARVGALLSRARETVADEVEATAVADGHLADMVGSSRAMKAVFLQVQQLAKRGGEALILGETGTGKELVAQALHALGERARSNFTAINCGGLSEELLHSTLFGHTAGAFTGASGMREGLFQSASGGTLFLDEVGEMPTSLQQVLLRTLETRTVRKLGATKEEKVDVRLLAATHRDLGEMVEDGSLREDLYYRLTAAEVIVVPPLRERLDDVPILAAHFLARLGRQPDIVAKRFSEPALARLTEHSWPGNVRELRNVVQKTAWRATSATIRADEVVLDGMRPPRPRVAATWPNSLTDVVPLDENERRYLQSVFELVDGNVSRLAKLLRVPRGTLRDKLELHAIHQPKRRQR